MIVLLKHSGPPPCKKFSVAVLLSSDIYLSNSEYPGKYFIFPHLLMVVKDCFCVFVCCIQIFSRCLGFTPFEYFFIGLLYTNFDG